jgi:hypothetical protein
MSVQTNGRRITRADIEAAFGKVVGEGEEAVDKAMPQGLVVAGAVALVVVTLVYLAGKRRGRRKSSVIEIRRL